MLEEAEMQFEDGKTPPVKIKQKRGGRKSATKLIRQLLAEGFRGNVFYYRDNDRRLILKVWRSEGLRLTKDQKRKFLYDVTFPDTITRARRDLRGEFPDSQPVQEKRFRLFIKKRDEFSKGGKAKRFFS